MYRSNDLLTVRYIGEFKDGWSEVGLKGKTIRVKYEGTTCVYIVKDWCTPGEAEAELKLIFAEKHAADIGAHVNMGDIIGNEEECDLNFNFGAVYDAAFESEARRAIGIQHCFNGR